MPKSTILLSSARSGTNFFLAVYKKCFPDDFVVKEIFRRGGDNLDALAEQLGVSREQVIDLQISDPLTLWKRIKQSCESGKSAAVAKIFYYHDAENTALREHFRDNDRVVHLIRRNAFDVFLSERMARKTGQWQEFKRTPAHEVESIELDPEELAAFRQRQTDFVSRAREFFCTADYTEIFYEDIAGSPGECATTLERIYGSLKSPAPKQVGLIRQKKKSNRELVANYDAVKHLDGAIF
ncbi:MAG: hypothetical protein AAFM92_12900 [Pseudomonadota bacterium]